MDPHPNNNNNNNNKKKPPKRRDDRVILHFDLDCFYAQCVENRQPHLKSLPLGIKQKSILATCNYEARRRGVKKLMLISDAKKICPDLVIADGEDLSPFRDVSKRLYALLRSYSWSGKIERLGLDEVFLDVTDMVSYNVGLLNRNTLQNSFFCLSRDDPERGFECNATEFAGCIHGQVPPSTQAGLDNNLLYMRLLLASHLARYLRLKIEEQGFTTSCGISTNKVLAKLVGNENKPRNQTTLLAIQDHDALSFMDGHRLRSVPGIGSKITNTLEAFVLQKEITTELHSMECSVTVGDVRTHPGISPPTLEQLLTGPGSERGLGTKVWCLLHGVDDTTVKPGRDVPTQISIEDTYKGLNEPGEIRRELNLIATSLLKRMRVDLVDMQQQQQQESPIAPPPKWTAYPKTIRLTTRPKTSPADGKPYNWARASRSGPLPSFVFSSATATETIVDKLVVETLLPMFHQLNPGKKRDWNIGLINICVTNMSGTDAGVPSGRDIGVMFRRQEDVLREFRVYDSESSTAPAPSMTLNEEDIPPSHHHPSHPTTQLTTWTKDSCGIQISASELIRQETIGDDKPEDMDVNIDQEEQSYHDYDSDDDDDYEEEWGPGGHTHNQQEDSERCPLCGHFIPLFALTAHDRFHSLEDDHEDGR